MSGFALTDLLGSRRSSMLPLGTLSLGIWVTTVVQLSSLVTRASITAVMTTSFFLIFSKHSWDKLRANLPHIQFLANNCVYSSHPDIKLCTYCLYRHTTVLIHEILYLANQLWCIVFLTPPTPLIIPHRFPAFLESLMPLKDWCSIHARCSKTVWSIPYVVSVAFFQV